MARGLTTMNRRRELAVQNALLDRIAAGFERSMARIISNTMKQAVNRFVADNSDIGVDSVVLQNQAKVQKFLADQYRFILVQYGERILSGLKSHKPTVRKDANDLFLSKVEQYIGTWALNNSELITATTMKQLRNLISDGQVEGLGNKEIAKNIRAKIPSISNVRANTIARTETHSAAGYANESAAIATGLNLKKEWVAFIDGREREAHAEADGQVVNRDEEFTVDGEQLQYAGDPSGSAGNIINCRCVILYFEE
jgi:uncharacterized protein with gpF-like domain